MAVQLDTREVQVERINERGFKSTDGDWLNVSKFAGAVVMPTVGARVTVTLDRSGFVRKVEPIAPPASAKPQTDSGNIAAISPTIVQDDRGVVITRLACINSATAILASGGGATTLEEVLEVAGRLEVWASR